MNQRRIHNKLPVAREGFPFIIIGLALTFFSAILHVESLAILFALLTAFTIFFFRDPDRVPVTEEKAVVTPADGKVLSVDKLENGDSRTKDAAVKISIFMSIFNAHVNRIPIKGKIAHISYHAGRFFSANTDKASFENEHNTVTLETDDKKTIVCVQIAGLIARRIACWVKPGDYVDTGQRFGLIRFGSRLEVYLPPDTIPIVEKGDKVKAGLTIIGYLS